MEDKIKIVSNNIQDIAIGYTEILKEKIEVAKINNSDDEFKEIKESIKYLNPLIGVMSRIEILNNDENRNSLQVVNYYSNYED